MSKGIFYTHQGWTDIINCLSLINYYCDIYKEIYVIMRDDAKQIINTYIKNISNVKIIYLDKNMLDNTNILTYLKKNNEYNGCDLLFHGVHDVYRNDIYRNSFNSRDCHFVNAFYSCYKINYNVRINNFKFERNNELEYKIYRDFIEKYSPNYVLHHEINENNSNYKEMSYINLNGISNTFFDYIQVIEHAKELHLLDSVWAAIIYLIDCKYNLFQNKKIYVYCKRGHNQMFTEPIKLNNWIII
jgi:hypothetical protein